MRAEPLPRRAPPAHEFLVAAGPVTTGVEKLRSDYPRGVCNGLACWWFLVPDAFPVAPALTVAFLFAHRRAPVSLLALLPWRGRQSSPGRSRSSGQYETNNSIAKIGCSPARFPFSPPAAARRAPSGCCTGERRGVCGQGAGVTMTLPGKRKQALQGCNHCRGITWRAHRDDDRSAETRASALCKNTHRIGRPLCLENPRPKGGMLFHGATPPSLHSPPPSIRGVVPTGPPKWPPPPAAAANRLGLHLAGPRGRLQLLEKLVESVAGVIGVARARRAGVGGG